MHSLSAFSIARLAIIILGATFLVLSTFFTRPWPFAGWVKLAFWMLGLAGITWGAIKMALLLYGYSLSRQTYHFLYTTEVFFLGIAFGVLALFLFSGEAYRGVQRWRELKAMNL